MKKGKKNLNNLIDTNNSSLRKYFKNEVRLQGGMNRNEWSCVY